MAAARSGPLVPGLAAARFAVGTSSWLAPDRLARTFGLGGDRVMAQLFGSRDIALALGVADTADPQLRFRALQLGVLVDTLDAVATIAAWRRGTVGGRAALLVGGGAATFAAAGLVALAGDPSDEQRAPDPRAGATRQALGRIIGGFRGRAQA